MTLLRAPGSVSVYHNYRRSFGPTGGGGFQAQCGGEPTEECWWAPTSAWEQQLEPGTLPNILRHAPGLKNIRISPLNLFSQVMH